MRKSHMHIGEQGTRVSYASTEHSTSCKATTQLKIPTPDTDLLPAAPCTTAHIIICENDTHAHGGMGHARELRLNRTLHGAQSNNTMKNANPDTHAHTYSLQRRT